MKIGAMQDAVMRSVIAGLALSWFCLLAPLAARAEDRVEVSYWTSPGQVRQLAEIFEQYEKENPGVKIIVGQSAARNLVDDPQRVLCSIVGGDPPDVIVFDRYAVGEWAARGAFMSMDDFVKADAGRPDGIRESDYYKPCWEEACYKGHLYGVPTGCDNRALYYNKDLLIKEGLVDENGEARPPRSWAELREYSRKMFKTDQEDPSKIRDVGFVPNYGNSWLYIYGWQNKATFMSADGRKCLLNEPPVVEALTFMKSMYDDMGGAENVRAFEQSFQGGENDPFITGRVAMKIDGNWSLSGIAQFKPDMNFGVCAAPMADANAPAISWMGGWAWVIPAGAKHPREAWNLIRKLASRDTIMHLAEIDSRIQASQGKPYIPGFSANRNVTEELYKKYVENNPAIDRKFAEAVRVFIDLLPRSKYRPVTPVGQLLWNQQVEAMDNAISGAMTPQAALDAGTVVVQRELDRVLVPETGTVVNWSTITAIYFGLILLATIAGLVWFYRRFSKSLETRKEAWAGWGFASPWVIGFLVFTGGPILCSLVMAFCSYDALSPSRFVGLRNFEEMVTTDQHFGQSMGNTLFMVIGIPLGMAVGLGVALLLNMNVRAMRVYRTVYYLPAIVPGVASALLWILIFDPNSGLLNAGLHAIGISGPKWLADRNWSKPALIVQGLWGAGAGMIVWLAGLKSISPELYEAAAIDGCTAWQRFRYITIPMLTPYIFFNVVMGLIGTFQIFGPAYLMTAGGPQNSTLFFAYYLFNHSFRYLHMGYASALAWVLFLIIFALTALQNHLSKRWVHYAGD